MDLPDQLNEEEMCLFLKEAVLSGVAVTNEAGQPSTTCSQFWVLAHRGCNIFLDWSSITVCYVWTTRGWLRKELYGLT